MRLLDGMHGDFGASVVDAMNKCRTRYRDNFGLAVMRIKAALAHQSLHHAALCGQNVRARVDHDVNVAPEPRRRVERQPHWHDSESPDARPH